MNKRKTGEIYEELARRFIREQGASVIETNYRVRRGEIDIIAMDGKYLCFIEVKYRRSGGCGEPEEAVGYAKQKQICSVSTFYLYSKGISEDTPIRYDVIAISGEKASAKIKWHKNAFEYCG